MTSSAKMSSAAQATTHSMLKGTWGSSAQRPRARRKLAHHMPLGLPHLTQERRDDLTISRDDARVGGRAEWLHLHMQCGERMIGHHREHVMLDMVVHVPVEEPH